MRMIDQIVQFLDEFAPQRLAEDWDNVGLLVGDRQQHAARLMTCLTVTRDSVSEAIDERVNLIVSHHPLPFRPLKRITTDSTAGRLLWQLAGAQIAVYSPHTAFDSTSRGINQRLAEAVGLVEIKPLLPVDDDPLGLGAGRWGKLPVPRSLEEIAVTLKDALTVTGMHRVGELDRKVRCIAVACGSAGQFLDVAGEHACDLLVTGETSFHTCLEAEARNISLLLPGHYASERFAVELLAEEIADRFPEIEVWASRREHDPLAWC